MKKLVFLTLLITATLLLTLAFSAAATGPRAPAAVVAVLSSPAAAATTQEYRRPNIHEAIEAMRNAREHLQQAQGNFHGHRQKAIDHLNSAIHEAEICEHE